MRKKRRLKRRIINSKLNITARSIDRFLGCSVLYEFVSDLSYSSLFLPEYGEHSPDIYPLSTNLVNHQRKKELK